MAIKKLYIGPLGPYIWDDTATIDDPDGDFSGETRRSFVTDKQIYIDDSPTENEHVIRKVDIEKSVLVPIEVADIDDPSAELNILAGSIGTLLMVYEDKADTDEFTIYAWDDANTGGEDVPYVVDGSSGFWVAIAGKYSTTDVSVNNSYKIATGESVTISDYEQIIVVESYIIEGTGYITIDGAGILAVCN